MIKRIVFVCVIYAILLFYLPNVNAYYNGEGGSFTTPTGAGSSCEGHVCQYNNFNTVYLQIRLYYMDATDKNDVKWKQIGGTYYATRDLKGDKDYLIKTVGINEKNVIAIKDMNSIDTQSKNKYKEASNALRKYFGNIEEKKEKVINKNLDSFLKKCVGNNYLEVLTEETNNADPTGKKPAKKGYRIIIEPAISYVNASWSSGGGSLISVKGAAVKRVKLGGIWYIDNLPMVNGDSSSSYNNQYPQSQYLFTEFEDVGISKTSQNYCSKISLKELANVQNGCGYNIIDVGQVLEPPPTCYKKTVKNETGSLKCEKTNENNVMNFTEKYEETDCATQEKEDESNTKYGKKIYETDNTGNCAVYCIESAQTSFPGHLASAQDLDAVNGAYFTWPSKIGTDGMKMYMNLKYTCRIIQKNGKKCSENDITNIKRAVSSNLDQIEMSASLEAGDNKKINESLTSYYSFDEKGIITNLLDDNDKEVTKISFNSEGISNRIVMSKKLYYKIPDNKNRLYDKETDRVYDGIGAATGIFDRGKGVISLSRNLDVNKKYNLIIKNVDLGTADQFGKLIDKTGYVCTYTVMKTCRCPAGTLNEDEPLYEELTKDKSCAELIATKCDICKCPPDSLYPNKVLAVGNDVTTKACQENIDEICYQNCKKYKGTILEEELKGQEKEDFNKCIKENVENGYTKEEAYNICDEKYCSYCITPVGTTINLYESTCMREELKSYEECYPLYCSTKTDCPPGTCCNCNWEMGKTETKIDFERICKISSEDGCGYVSLTCPNPNEKFISDPLECIEITLKGKLNGKNVLQALDSLTISEDDLRYAVNVCKPKVCSGDISEGKIIYRQIDLNDPFPGKNWAGTDKLIDASNNSNNKKNRTPGENWNSKTFIDTKILNARGAKGYNLYYEKNPLYIIKLTPETIKKIREYNKTTKYDDFKLDCKTANGGAACISNFLHTRGTIKNLNYDDFILKSYVENNVEKNSVSACYNMNYSEAGFNDCYNARN